MATCALCCDESQAWAVGPCDHASCLVCSVRLRVLCDQRDCPVCREKLDKVVVTNSLKTFSLPPRGSKIDRKYGFIFEETHLYDKYKSLQLYRCSKCHDKPIFQTFTLLHNHCRKTHGLHYCDICSDNLKLFPYELHQYTRQELLRHRREGDPDDKSYKGHPLCQFCDNRFLDNDILHAHLRKEHFWCHFCESDGKQDYYCNYPLLRNHFRSAHFLCEEGPCQQEKFTSVFRSKLDLQAHRATAHTRGVSKAEAKQMRQLDMGFMYGRLEEPRIGGVVNAGGGGGGGGRSQWQHIQRGGRPNKARENEHVVVVTAVTEGVRPPPLLQQQQQQQQQHRESKSPQSSRRNASAQAVSSTSSSTAGDNRPTHMMYEQPPRLKQRQERRQEQNRSEPVEERPKEAEKDRNKVDSRKNANIVAAVPQVKKPPGFETAQHSATVNSDPTSEWPDLLALSIAAEVPKQPSKAVTSTAKMMLPQKFKTPVVNYNPLEPSHFPPLSGTAATYPNNSNLALLGQQPTDNADKYSKNSSGVSASIPPGFVTPEWQQIQEDSIYSKPGRLAVSSKPTYTASTTSSVLMPQQSSGRNKEDYVIDQVRQALNHDREKFNHFRNLSGWYRNSEITVQDYVLHCRQLFGERMWNIVGPLLAQVMPIEGKRNELVQNIYPVSNPAFSTVSTNFPSSAFPVPRGTASISDAVLRSHQARWGEDRRSVPNWQSEREYPTLHTGSTTSLTGPVPGIPQSWKARVPV